MADKRGWNIKIGESKSKTTAIYMPCQSECIIYPDQDMCHAIFNSIDANEDGCVQIKELKRFLKSDESMQYPKGFCTMLFKRADQNKDETVSFDEFKKLCNWTPANEILTNSYFQKSRKAVMGPIKAHFLPESEFNHDYAMMQFKSIPLLIISICIIQIMFFINDQIHNSYTLQNVNETCRTFSTLSGTMLFSTNRKIELWRFLTYMFVQTDYLHISSNVVMQLFTGVPLEMAHGCWRTLGVLLTSVLAGSMSIAALSKATALVGASAGAYGLLGAHFSTIILNWHEMAYRPIRVFILIVYVTVDIFLWVYNPINGLENTTLTHVSGFVIGFLLGVVFLRNLHKRWWETRLQIVCLSIYGIIMLIQIGLIVL